MESKNFLDLNINEQQKFMEQEIDKCKTIDQINYLIKDFMYISDGAYRSKNEWRLMMCFVLNVAFIKCKEINTNLVWRGTSGSFHMEPTDNVPLSDKKNDDGKSPPTLGALFG